MDKQRLEAGRALGHLLPKIAEDGHTTAPIHVFLADDSLPYVLGRLVRDAAGSKIATLAVYWPEEDGRLDVVTFEGSQQSPPDSFDVGATTSIGMVVDTARHSGGVFRFKTSTIMGEATSSVSAPLAFA